MCTADELDEPASCPGYKAFGWCAISRDVFPFMRECNFTCGICQRKYKYITVLNTTLELVLVILSVGEFCGVIFILGNPTQNMLPKRVPILFHDGVYQGLCHLSPLIQPTCFSNKRSNSSFSTTDHATPDHNATPDDTSTR